ncbi:hypothetical protein PHISCL_09135 [Aspergillus sclerotialis]|uniref:Uncharacterized protein n=1 Tax=Aspergillus sclerotialis TaxID=2070753 RepID=A0A3A2ZN52_9EURO|nr:hypothetical protein PHISCL_09135 [Aspergillus sclerotialis]
MLQQRRQSQNSNWQPCNSTDNPNACCSIGTGDICTTAGLCLRQDTYANGWWYQDGCTNQDWDGCPNMCPGTLDDAWELVACDSQNTPGVWCCREPGNTDNCCTNQSAVTTTNIGKVVLPTVTISGTATGTVPPATGILVTVTSTPTSGSGSDSSACSNNSVVAVGAGTGVSLGVMLLASIAVLIWREKTRPKIQEGSGFGGGVAYQMGGQGKDMDIRPPAEMDSAGQVYEVEGGQATRR